MKPITSILEIPRELWEKIRPENSPFLSYDFFKALEESHSIGPNAGWVPLYFLHPSKTALLYTFVKSHSYGEYIFDWEWARAYERHNVPYYPKLTSMIPITPATTPHFIMKEFDQNVALELLTQVETFYQSYNFSSMHFLFLSTEEISLFKNSDYLVRESLQYHFFNDGYPSFEDFLSKLKTKKAKNIRKEREFLNLEIEKITGIELNNTHAKEMYQFYLSTIEHKNAMDYLKEDFFIKVFESMKNQILYVRASKDNEVIAGSLFFYDSETLYGRYWGTKYEVLNLHFELCYYQGIDFCISNKLSKFEAGAQGEHKIPRGFKPIKTYSAHKLKEKVFSDAISRYIEEEKGFLQTSILELSQLLPFKET